MSLRSHFVLGVVLAVYVLTGAYILHPLGHCSCCSACPAGQCEVLRCTFLQLLQSGVFFTTRIVLDPLVFLLPHAQQAWHAALRAIWEL